MSVDDIVPPKSDGEDASADEAAPTVTDVSAGLHDCLADARELAHKAQNSEDRTRQALYDAVSRAYDVSLAAQDAPDEFAELLEDNDLSVQERAPMTPVVKLVFGVDYDKTRLTEYAAVLTHAHRAGIARGGLSTFLSEAEGGLKGVVQAERQIRKEEAGETPPPANAVKPALAKKLRALEGVSLEDFEPSCEEFGVLMVRRLPDGSIEVVGEVAGEATADIALIEKVARALLK